jgi:1-acyl-sn-glycerol-3-phosphate acyltransferase
MLIPIAVSSGRCWPRRSFWFIPGRIDVSIGPPIHPEERSADDLMREVERWIETEMRRIDPDAYAAADTAPGSS